MRNNILVALGFLLIGAASGCGNANTLANLQGTWKTSCQSAGSGAYAQDVLAFSNTTNLSQTTTSYSDSACTASAATVIANFTSVTVGNLISGSSYNQISATVSSIQVTPDTASAATNYNSMSYCGFTNWTAGTAKDVTGNSACGMKSAGTVGNEGFSISGSNNQLNFINNNISSPVFDLYDNLSTTAITSFSSLVSPPYTKQ